MALILGPRTYPWPVLVPVPHATLLGQFEQRQLVANFRPLDNDQEEELLSGLARAGRQRDQRRERLRLVLRGLTGLTDAGGAATDWAAAEGDGGDDPALERLLADPRLVAALDKAYLASVAGVPAPKAAGIKDGYVLDQDVTWRFPIDVELPDQHRPGKTVTHRVIGTFRDLPADTPPTTPITDAVVDVEGFQDAAGKAVPWAQARKVALQDPAISNAIIVAYQRGLEGIAVQNRREGN